MSENAMTIYVGQAQVDSTDGGVVRLKPALLEH